MNVNFGMRSIIAAGIGIGAFGLSAVVAAGIGLIRRTVDWRIPTTAAVTAAVGAWLYDWYTERRAKS